MHQDEILKTVDNRRERGTYIFIGKERIHIYWYGGYWNKDDPDDAPSQIINEQWFSWEELEEILENKPTH